MNSKWLPYDQALDEHSKREVTLLLRTFLLIIPLVAVILAMVNFSLGLNQIALTILTVPIFCIISLAVLNKGMINLSIIILLFVYLLVGLALDVLRLPARPSHLPPQPAADHHTSS